MHDRPILPDGRVPQRDRSGRAPMGYRSRRGGAATSERLRWEHIAQYHRWRLRQLPSCLSGCSTSAVAQAGVVLTAWASHVHALDRTSVMLRQVRGRCPEALNLMESDLLDPAARSATPGTTR